MECVQFHLRIAFSRASTDAGSVECVQFHLRIAFNRASTDAGSVECVQFHLRIAFNRASTDTGSVEVSFHSTTFERCYRLNVIGLREQVNRRDPRKLITRLDKTPKIPSKRWRIA